MGIFSGFGKRRSSGKESWLHRIVVPEGHDDSKDDELKAAVEADVEVMEEQDHKYFKQDGPGKQQDEL